MTAIDADEPPEPISTVSSKDQLLADTKQAPDALLPATDGATALHLLNRSPHPYHRRKAQLRNPEQPQHTSAWRQPWSSTTSSDNDKDDSGAASPRPAAPTSSYPSQAASRSMSESGTEADDEAYSFVKALPAPPMRPHKGLRDLRSSETFSPSDSGLLTPNQLEEEGRRLGSSPGYFFKGKGKGGGREEEEVEAEEGDEEVRKERERYTKRRRAELLRRGCEVALLAAIGVVVLRGAAARKSLNVWSRGTVVP